jgi:UDP-2,4-diacetamido-2,4,6-trideoxy-beta-L-altropyranose hydrolase
MSQKSKVYFRADGNSKMGLGHVIRSLALVEMINEDFECHFMIRNPLPTLIDQINEVCKSIIILEDTLDDIKEAIWICNNHLSGDEIVVLDGYHFITEYQQLIKDKGCKLVCIDDIHAYHFVADVVVNQIGGIKPEHYSAEAYTKFYLGLEFSLLRKPFLEFDSGKKVTYPPTNIFICLGGADPLNLSAKVVEMALNISFVKKVDVVLGAGTKINLGKLTNIEKKVLRGHRNLSATQMKTLIRESDAAIVPASTIAIEVYSLKVPMLVGFFVDNQSAPYNYWIKNNLAVDLGDIRELKSSKELELRLLDINQLKVPQPIANIIKIKKIFSNK